MLRAAAVLGDPADEPTLLAVSALELDRFTDALVEALRCRLIGEREGGLVEFRHALAARAIHESTPLPERRLMHGRAGEVLEGRVPQPLARLSRHFREAGKARDWCRYGARAAELALAAGDEATATAVLHELITQGNLPAAEMARLTNKIPLAVLSGTGLRTNW